MNDRSSESINSHYKRTDYSQRILDALKDAGVDLDTLTRDDLTPFEEFHIGGREETRSLANSANLSQGTSVLDIGSGIGGPARTLAAEFGCLVTGIDLTEAYCNAAEMLTERVGLSESVKFVHGSALEMSFDDSSFDTVWTQHTTMNIEDKEQLYKEIFRVLRSGGQLAMHDIMAGTVEPIHYPVLWAGDASISFLRKPEEMRTILEKSGFSIVEWIDKTESAVEFWKTRINDVQIENNNAPLGLGVIVSEEFVQRAVNVARNLTEERIVVVAAVLSRN